MKLFLVRHGQTAWTVAKRYQGTTDIPLNQEGIRQAQAIARILRRERPTRLYTSTLQRTRQTGHWIAKACGMKSIKDSRLNELDFGKWEGSYYDGLLQTGGEPFKEWREGKLAKPPGGESLASLARRVGQFLKELLRHHSEETVVVVSHGGPIKMFLLEMLKIPFCSLWSFRIEPASICLIEGNKYLLQIVWTNRTDHL